MSATRVQRALRMGRTVRHLKPAQVAHRIRLRAQRAVLARVSEPLLTRLTPRPLWAPGWPDGYVPIDARLAEGCPSPETNAQEMFTFIGESRRLGSDWTQADASQLWRYHLHYFEWAWAFAAHRDQDWARQAFAALWHSWRRSTPLARGDAWSPYVASLRSWVLCGVHRRLVSGTDLEDQVLTQLGAHAALVRTHLELDVGGNHLVKNLKALMGLGVFLADDHLLDLAARHLERQLTVQVLDDGAHFERSPGYHCQVLGDLLDLEVLLAAAGCPPVTGVEKAISGMRQWLGSMLLPDGDVPLFNDCTLVGRRRLALLRPTAPPPGPLTVLQPSGFVVMRPDERVHLVADVGPPCPPGLPAHAHADCLSFELSLDGRRVIVDTGTSTYGSGERRAYERATRSHNTLEIDGSDQTEVWGAFRAGHRAEATLEAATSRDGLVEVTASHDGYRRLPGRPRHRRTWRVRPNLVEIVDEVDGDGRHRIASRLYIAGEDVLRLTPGVVHVGPLTVIADNGVDLSLVPAQVATGFGQRREAAAIVMSCEANLPLVLQTRLQLSRSLPGQSPTDAPIDERAGTP